MYRRVLPLLLTAVLLLSGCTAGQKNIPQKTDEKERTGQPSDMSGEGSMYMDTTENVIYLGVLPVKRTMKNNKFFTVSLLTGWRYFYAAFNVSS